MLCAVCPPGRLSESGKPHHVRGRASCLEFFRHEAHVRVNMVEEVFVPFTQIIQSRLAIRSIEKTMFGTLSMARKAHRALTAHGGQRSKFVRSKFLLQRREGHGLQRGFGDISEAVFWIDEMVT